MNEQLIKGAIKNLIDGSKRILIPNAIITLTANLNEACGYDDFYKIDYLKYGKRIIDDSNLPPKRKEEIHQRFKNPSPANNGFQKGLTFFLLARPMILKSLLI